MITPSVVEQLQRDKEPIARQIRYEMVCGMAFDGVQFDGDQLDGVLQALDDAIQECINRIRSRRWHDDCKLCDLAELMAIAYDQAHQVRATIGKVADAEAR